MIHFNCTSCGRPVRVANVCAGRRGRCPACNQVVSIPAGSIDGQGQLSDLAEVVQDRNGRVEAAGRTAPPPPIRKEDTNLPEDLLLEPQGANPSMETDVMPAEHSDPLRAGQDLGNARASAPRALGSAGGRSRESARRIVALVVIVLGMALVLALAIYLKFMRGR